MPATSIMACGHLMVIYLYLPRRFRYGNESPSRKQFGRHSSTVLMVEVFSLMVKAIKVECARHTLNIFLETSMICTLVLFLCLDIFHLFLTTQRHYISNHLIIGLINNHVVSLLAPLHSFPWVSYAQFSYF